MDTLCTTSKQLGLAHLLPLPACVQYWDSISCLAGEVDNPSRTFPRALLWAVLLVVASYFLPTLAALGVAVDTADWQLGYYGKVAQQVCDQN
jgi:amino acid transporter